jgi:hypothetical protein
LAGHALFGLNAFPFRLVVFATQFANLALVAIIGRRLTGSRAAGFWAAVFWAVNSALVYPLGWACVYNQPLCGLFLLLGFYFLLRYVETGDQRFNAAQWIVFLLGFGALETNIVYPAIAAGYTFLQARKYFRGTLALFVPSVLYGVLHFAVAPLRAGGTYGMDFGAGALKTAATYWAWAVSSGFLWTPLSIPAWVIPVGAAIISIALIWFAVAKLRAKCWIAAFFLLWFAATIAPMAPLVNHMTEYYPYLPAIGLCWLGGWAFAEAWRASQGHRAAAILVATLYAFVTVPAAVAGTEWTYRLSERVRNLVAGAAGARSLHPGKTILLQGVDTELFWNAVAFRPFRLAGVEQIYLAPDSGRSIEARPEIGDPADFALPAAVTVKALQRDEVVVYDASGPKLRNITTAYAAHPPKWEPPLRVDAGSKLSDYLLDSGWYKSDGDHRWMAKKATLHMGGPAARGAAFHLSGDSPVESLKDGPVTVTVDVDGKPLPPAKILPGQENFQLEFPLPPGVVGKPDIEIGISVDRTFRPASDPRDLGLAFGLLEIK